MALEKKTVVVGASVAIGLVLAGLAGVAYWTRSSTLETLAEQQSQLEMLQEQLDSADDQPAVVEIESNVCWQLQNGPEVVATMQVLQRLGDAAGVAFDGLKAMRSADNGKQSFSVTGRGTPDSVCSFLAAVEQDDRLMIVETGQLVPAGGDQIAFELGLATYHQGGQ